MTEFESLDREIESRSLKRHAVQGGLATVASQGVRFLIRIVSQIAIARLLMPADYGLIAMVAPVLALVQLVAELGLGQALVQRKNLRQAEISGVFWFGLGVTVLMAAALAAASPLIALMYGEPKLVLITILMAALIPISGSAVAHSALLARDLRLFTQALLDIGPPLLGFAGGYAAAHAGLGYWSLLIMAAAENLSRTVAIWSVSRWRPSAPAYDPSIWSLIRVGGDVAGYNLASYITSAADNFLLGLVGGKVELGLYDRGYRLVTQPIGQLLSPFSRVAVPLLMRLTDEAARYRSAFLTMVQLMLLATTPGLLWLAVFAKPTVLLLLGEKWIGTAPVIAWFCLGGLASPLYACTFWLFVTQYRTRQQLKYVFAMSALSVAAFAAGLPWGAHGVSAAGALSFTLVTTPLVLWGAMRTGPVKVGDLAAALAPLFLAGLFTAGGLYALSVYVSLPALVLLPLGLVAAYGAFALGLLLLPQGRRLLRETWALRRQVRAAKPDGQAAS